MQVKHFSEDGTANETVNHYKKTGFSIAINSDESERFMNEVVEKKSVEEKSSNWADTISISGKGDGLPRLF